MYKFLILIFSLQLVTISCQKEDDKLTHAVILGYDLRYCACCGGLIVQVPANSEKKFQWYQKNNDFSITANDTFPLSVKLKFHHLAESCVASDGEIEITELIKI